MSKGLFKLLNINGCFQIFFNTANCAVFQAGKYSGLKWFLCNVAAFSATENLQPDYHWMNEKWSRMTFTDKVLTKIIIKIIRMRSTTGRPQLADIQPYLHYAEGNSRMKFFSSGQESINSSLFTCRGITTNSYATNKLVAQLYRAH